VFLQQYVNGQRAVQARDPVAGDSCLDRAFQPHQTSG
jgi:hypothetical protein